MSMVHFYFFWITSYLYIIFQNIFYLIYAQFCYYVIFRSFICLNPFTLYCRPIYIFSYFISYFLTELLIYPLKLLDLFVDHFYTIFFTTVLIIVLYSLTARRIFAVIGGTKAVYAIKKYYRASFWPVLINYSFSYNKVVRHDSERIATSIKPTQTFPLFVKARIFNDKVAILFKRTLYLRAIPILITKLHY